MSDYINIEFSLQTNKIGSKVTKVVEFDREEWESLSEEDQSDYAKEVFWDDVLASLGEWDYKELS